MLGYFNHYFVTALSTRGFTREANVVLGVYLTQLTAFLLVSLKNPGIMTRSTEFNKVDSQQRYCQQCQVVQSSRDQHCEMCEVCIRGLDHHCIWTGKCIGQDNQYSFYAILVMTCLEMVLLIILALLVI